MFFTTTEQGHPIGSLEGLGFRGPASRFSYFKESASEWDLRPNQNTKDLKQKSKTNPIFDASFDFSFS